MDADIINQAKRRIPSVDEIISSPWRKLGFTKEFVFENFGQALVEFDKRATESFRDYEKKALKELAKLWISNQKRYVREKTEDALMDEDNMVNKLSELFSEFGELVKEFEKDLGNMRKARGGKTFEKVILRLLNFIGIPCEAPRGEYTEFLRRIDLVVPNLETAIKSPDRAVFLTCKRTLRERWKQEVPSIGPNQIVYLITIDGDISESKIEEIKEKGLIIFVRDEIKERHPHKPWVRKLSNLPRELRRYGTT
ncbi:type II restriction endonuclease [Thermocrinis sp.]